MNNKIKKLKNNNENFNLEKRDIFFSYLYTFFFYIIIFHEQLKIN